MELAQRVQQLPPYLFARISEMIAEKRAAGIDVISLGIGDPDIPTPSYLIDVLKSAADKPCKTPIRASREGSSRPVASVRPLRARQSARAVCSSLTMRSSCQPALCTGAGRPAMMLSLIVAPLFSVQ